MLSIEQSITIKTLSHDFFEFRNKNKKKLRVLTLQTRIGMFLFNWVGRILTFNFRKVRNA